MRRLWEKYRRLVLFCAVGGLNTAADHVVRWIVLSLTGGARASDAASLLAVVLGTAAGLMNSYLMNRAFTFRREVRARRDRTRFLRFLCVNALTLSLGYGAVVLLKRAGMDARWANLPTIPLTMVINYLGYKLFVFKGAADADDRSGSD